MIENRFFKCIAVNLLWIIIIYSSNVVANEKLTIALESWPPYMDRNHPNLGVASEIVTTALDRAEYKFDTTFGNWSEILEGAKIGVYDVLVAGWYSKEREKYFEYSDPYLFNEIKFIKLKNKPYKFDSIDDLSGKLIGIVQDYAYSPEFDSSKIPIKVSNRHLIQNLLLLQQEKIDLTLDDEWVIRHQLVKYMPRMINQFEIIDKPLARRGLHLLVSLKNNNHKIIIDDFNKIIKEMKADNTFNKIINSYEKELSQLRY